MATCDKQRQIVFSFFVRLLYGIYQNFPALVLRIIKRRPFGCKFLALALEKKGAPVMESTKYVGLDVFTTFESGGSSPRTDLPVRSRTSYF